MANKQNTATAPPDEPPKDRLSTLLITLSAPPPSHHAVSRPTWGEMVSEVLISLRKLLDRGAR